MPPPPLREPKSPVFRDITSTEKRVRRAFGLALFCLILIGLAAMITVGRSRRDAAQVEHTREVIKRLESLVLKTTDAQNGNRGYAISGDEAYLEPFLKADQEVPRDVQAVRSLFADNPDQAQRLDKLAALIEAQTAFGHKVVEARRNRGLEAARDVILTREGKDLHDRMRAIVAEMDDDEEARLARRQERARGSTGLAKAVIFFGTLFTFCFVGFALAAFRRDFAGRRHAEEALRNSEESLAVTLHSIGDAVLATDTAGRVTRMNEVAERLTGWTLTEARDRPIAEVFNIINETTRAPAVIPVNDVLVTGEVHGLANHTILIARDGAERSIADSAAPIRDAEGRVLGVVLVFRDVSEERAADLRLAAAHEELARERARLQFIFDNVPMGISFALTKPDGTRTRLVNDAHLRMCGLTREEFDDPQNFARITHPDDREAQARLLGELEAGRLDRYAMDKRYLHADGRVVWAFLTFQRRPHRDGSYEDLSIVVDITERKTAEAEIQQLNTHLRQRAAQVESANKELEAFSYSVSHDLRAPARHIQGFVNLLARESEAQLSEQSRHYLHVITKASHSMGQLIDDLLSFSRMARSEMHATTVDLDAIVAEARRDLESAAPERRIQWTVRSLPTAQGDRAMLKQVMANLLGNAVKYTRPRNPAVIEIGCAGTEGDRSVLYVRDNGVGFDMQYADKLFGVFQRLHHADEFEGTGIGLANVQRIVLRHGGRVWAESKLDAGATFFFTLPLAVTKPGATLGT